VSFIVALTLPDGGDKLRRLCVLAVDGGLRFASRSFQPSIKRHRLSRAIDTMVGVAIVSSPSALLNGPEMRHAMLYLRVRLFVFDDEAGVGVAEVWAW